MKKLTTKEFIKRSNKIHKNKYDYSNVIYVNNRTEVKIICPVHGEFLQKPEYHLAYHGCSICGDLLCGEKNRKTKEKFVNDAVKIHKEKYDYSLVDYKSALEKVKIICPVHGEFLQKPSSHLNGNGCLKCSIERVANVNRNTQQKFLEKSERVHGKRYDYSKSVYGNRHKKLQIICKLHGMFLQTPGDHFRGMGCPKCNLSKGEQKIISFLDTNRIKYTTQKTFDNCRNECTNCKLPFDFYIPSKNLLIEYDGEHHYKFGCRFGKFTTTKPDMIGFQKRDKIKTKFCKKNNIFLLRIKYTQFRKINEILNHHIL